MTYAATTHRRYNPEDRLGSIEVHIHVPQGQYRRMVPRRA
jgi:hypothetical protein